MLDLGECKPLHAKISERQCHINRARGIISCAKCSGLVNGKLVSEEKAMGTNKKKGTCVKCERPDMPIVARGLCHGCAYGSGAKMTKEQVLAAVAAGMYGVTGPKSPKQSVIPARQKTQQNQPVPTEPLSTLLPPPVVSPPARKGIFLDLTDFPELAAWLQETCGGEAAVPAAIIELLKARRNGQLRMVA